MNKKANVLIGTVVSNKCDETATILVSRVKSHPIYSKKYRVSKKYLAHNPDNKFKSGDQVEIVEIRPKSRNKSFAIVNKILT